jgi:tetratricopeptide (TPR) repeat protein
MIVARSGIGHDLDVSAENSDAHTRVLPTWSCSSTRSGPSVDQPSDAVRASRMVARVTGLTPELEQAIALGYERRDRADMAPTIAYFNDLLAQHPDHPVLTYELAGSYDTAGEEATARTLYERALELGLDGQALRRCLCQYGSTLRWLGELDASLAVLERARQQFPTSESTRVFHALTLNELGRADEAVGLLLGIVAQHGEVTDLGRYAVGLAGLSQWLIDGRPEDD